METTKLQEELFNTRYLTSQYLKNRYGDMIQPMVDEDDESVSNIIRYHIHLMTMYNDEDISSKVFIDAMDDACNLNRSVYKDIGEQVGGLLKELTSYPAICTHWKIMKSIDVSNIMIHELYIHEYGKHRSGELQELYAEYVDTIKEIVCVVNSRSGTSISYIGVCDITVIDKDGHIDSVRDIMGHHTQLLYMYNNGDITAEVFTEEMSDACNLDRDVYKDIAKQVRELLKELIQYPVTNADTVKEMKIVNISNMLMRELYNKHGDDELQKMYVEYKTMLKQTAMVPAVRCMT